MHLHGDVAHPHVTTTPLEQTLFLDEKWFSQTTPHTVRVLHGDLDKKYLSLPKVIQRAKVMFLCGITSAGVGGIWLCPPRVSGLTFLQMAAQCIVPFCQKHNITRIVLDNAPPHKHHSCTTYYKTTGIHWDFLPASSPDLNPIERVFGLIVRQLTDLNGGNLWSTTVLKSVIPVVFHECVAAKAAQLICQLPKVWTSVLQTNGENFNNF